MATHQLLPPSASPISTEESEEIIATTSMLEPWPANYTQSEIITLVVGPEQKIFKVHKDLLVAKSDYFRGALNHSFVESEANKIILDTEKVPRVENFLNWIYADKYEMSKTSRRAVLDYRFGDRLCCEAYRNAIVSAAWVKYRTSHIRMGRLELKNMYEMGLGGSKFAYLGLKRIVGVAMTSPQRLSRDGKSPFDEWIEQPQLLHDYAVEVLKYTEQPYNVYTDWDICDFHDHLTSEKCAASKVKAGG